MFLKVSMDGSSFSQIIRYFKIKFQQWIEPETVMTYKNKTAVYLYKSKHFKQKLKFLEKPHKKL